jgi:hypothetical protein
MTEPKTDGTTDSRLDVHEPQQEEPATFRISRLHLRLSPPRLVFIAHLDELAKERFSELQA